MRQDEIVLEILRSIVVVLAGIVVSYPILNVNRICCVIFA